MGDQQLNWGLIGTARINRAIIPAIRNAPRSRLAAVASRDHARATAYASEWEIPTAYDSYEALLADTAINAVYVPLPNHLHVEWTLKAIAAGKHVLCEKPIALDVEGVDAIAAAARAAGVVVTEAFMYRHHPQTARVEAVIADGAIGDIRLLRGAFTFMLDREHDVRLRPEWGGGSLWDVGCYPVSFARLLARGEPLAVAGLAVLGPTGIDVGFAGALRFPAGALALFDCGFQAPFRTEMAIVGSAGSLIIERPFKPGPRERLLLHREAETQEIDVAGEDLYVGEIRDLENAALDGVSPKVSLADSRGTVAALIALREAAARSSPSPP